MTRVVLVGTGITLLVSGAMMAIWGRSALLPGAAAGLLAVAIQVVAVQALRGGLVAGTTTALFKGFGVGMVLRVLGVALVTVAVLADRELFPPLPTAFGYLGVVVPLLFLEVRFAR